jgi:hypothetical protein
MNIEDSKFELVLNSILKFGKLESPLEFRLYNHFDKYLNEDYKIEPQGLLEIFDHKYRIDFVITNGKYSIGIECDGQEFHDGEEASWKDEWKDAMYLLHDEVTAVYRFVYDDIFNNLDCILLYLMNEEPKVFNQQNRSALKANCRFIDKAGEVKVYHNYHKRLFRSHEFINVIRRKVGKFNADIVWTKMLFLRYLHPTYEVSDLIVEFKKESDMKVLKSRLENMYNFTFDDEK